jgi:hypothetical protein
MRHVISVVGSEEQRRQPLPELILPGGEAVRITTWFASSDQKNPTPLLDDRKNPIVRILLAPVLAYRFYLLVQNTRLWSGKRPLLLVRGRSLLSRIAAYVGTWGGGDVVKADLTDHPPLSPTRFVIDADGNLKLHVA